MCSRGPLRTYLTTRTRLGQLSSTIPLTRRRRCLRLSDWAASTTTCVSQVGRYILWCAGFYLARFEEFPLEGYTHNAAQQKEREKESLYWKVGGKVWRQERARSRAPHGLDEWENGDVNLSLGLTPHKIGFEIFARIHGRQRRAFYLDRTKNDAEIYPAKRTSEPLGVWNQLTTKERKNSRTK